MNAGRMVRRWARGARRGMENVPRFVLILLPVSAALNVAGFALDLFKPVFLYDELAHFLTPFALVALVAEIAHRRGGMPLGTGLGALVAGAAVGLVGACAWEGVEILVDVLFPVAVFHPPLDTVSDVLLGTAGGALGVWRISRHGAS